MRSEHERTQRKRVQRVPESQRRRFKVVHDDAGKGGTITVDLEPGTYAVV